MRKRGGREVETEDGTTETRTEIAAETGKEKTEKDIGVQAGSEIEEEIVIEITSTSEIENMGGTRTTGAGTGTEKWFGGLPVNW